MPTKTQMKTGQLTNWWLKYVRKKIAEKADWKGRQRKIHHIKLSTTKKRLRWHVDRCWKPAGVASGSNYKSLVRRMKKKLGGRFCGIAVEYIASRDASLNCCLDIDDADQWLLRRGPFWRSVCDCFCWVKKFRRRKTIKFLIDTGSPYTIINAADVFATELDVKRLEKETLIDS